MKSNPAMTGPLRIVWNIVIFPLEEGIIELMYLAEHLVRHKRKLKGMLI